MKVGMYIQVRAETIYLHRDTQSKSSGTIFQDMSNVFIGVIVYVLKKGDLSQYHT